MNGFCTSIFLVVSIFASLNLSGNQEPVDAAVVRTEQGVQVIPQNPELHIQQKNKRHRRKAQPKKSINNQTAQEIVRDNVLFAGRVGIIGAGVAAVAYAFSCGCILIWLLCGGGLV